MNKQQGEKDIQEQGMLELDYMVKITVPTLN